ncbi:hypothetical protein ACJBXC_10825, partial [Streptococcus suis]
GGGGEPGKHPGDKNEITTKTHHPHTNNQKHHKKKPNKENNKTTKNRKKTSNYILNRLISTRTTKIANTII